MSVVLNVQVWIAMTRRTRNLEGERAKVTITMDGLQALTTSMRIPPMLRRGDHVSGHSLMMSHYWGGGWDGSPVKTCLVYIILFIVH